MKYQRLERVETIFANHFFTIPDYQRGYAWDTRQWDDLLQDLELLPKGKSHFMGTLILQPLEGDEATVRIETGGAGEVQSVIDGQQRLTTLVVLLKIVADEFERIGKPKRLVQGMRDTYLAVRDRNGQLKTRLTLNRDTQDFFYRNVLGFGSGVEGARIRSQELLDHACTHFSTYLLEKQKMEAKHYDVWLEDLFDKMTQQLNMIVYMVDDELDAGIIFETMNDRGKPLTELEKVKNYLLYLASKLDLPEDHGLGERINRTWTFVFQSLMEADHSRVEDEERLLRAHWLMVYDYDLRHWRQSRSIKAHFSLREYQGRHKELLNDLNDYLDALRDSATAFCDIHSPDRPNAFNSLADGSIRSEIVKWSRKIARLGPRTVFLPLLMAVRLKSEDDGKAYLRTLELCEKFDFRVYLWMDYRSNTALSSFYRLANQYFRLADPSGLEQELLSLHQHYCTQNQFEQRFELEDFNWYAWPGLVYLLFEYEHYLADGRDVKLSWENLERRKKEKSIEHVLPQAPSNPYWKKHFTKRELQRWTHDIGNLTITQDNPSLSNKPFPDKKGEPGKKGTYADSSLFVERAIAAAEEWTPEKILERRERIERWAVSRWQVDAPSPRKDEPDRDVDAMLSMAAQFGVEEEFRDIHTLSLEIGLHPRPHKRTMSYVLPGNWTKSAISVAPYPNALWMKVRPHNLARVKGIDEILAGELLGGPSELWLAPTEIPAVAQRLRRLLSDVAGERQAGDDEPVEP